MSNPTNETTEIAAPSPEAQKNLLLQRAKLMGLRISPNIGLDALRAKVNAALDEEEPEELPTTATEPESKPEEEPEELPVVAPVARVWETPRAKAAAAVLPVPETTAQKRNRLQKEAMKLVRIRVTCLNPNKKDLPGEIFTVGNRFIGTVKKYIPFGDQTENGYHVPYCLFEHLKDRKFLHIRTNKTKRDGIVVQTGYVPEFAIEVLQQLTPKELGQLAARQAMAAGTQPLDE
jgi:hypothetical protein